MSASLAPGAGDAERRPPLVRAASADLRIEWGLKAPMGDGVRLDVTAYLPGRGESLGPVVLTMTPYGADTYHELGKRFAKAGYACLFADVRGRGNSGGWFDPHVQEAADGPDLLDWVRRQPYCDGRVFMRGASYCGYAQWVTAAASPAGLATIVPTAAPFPGLDVPFRRNIFPAYIAQWLTLVEGRSAPFNGFGDSGYWHELFRSWRASGASFRSLASRVGGAAQRMNSWLDHPEPDAFWDARTPDDAGYRRITCPVLTITGLFDGDQWGALEHYRRHLAANAAAADSHYLVIGPWDHAGTSAPGEQVEGEAVERTGRPDIAEWHIAWFDWIAGQGPRPHFLPDRVNYYVMGRGFWRSAPSLELATGSRLRVGLTAASEKALGLVLRLRTDYRYTFDPAEREAPACAQAGAGGSDCAAAYRALAQRKIVFESDPLDADLELAGFFELRLWLSIDTPDTDLFVTLFAVDPEDGLRCLCSDAIRARYRLGDRTPCLIPDDRPQEYVFDRFRFVSRVLPRGTRLRLVVSPVSMETMMQSNWNGGGVVSDETIDDARAVTVSVVLDAAHPAHLVLPVGQQAPGAAR